MMILIQLAVMAIVLAFVVPFALAQAVQTAQPKSWVMTAVSVGHALLPVLLPFLVAGLKKLTNMLPGPVVQVVVLVLGVLLDQLGSYLSSNPSWGGYGVAAGLAAIGVHQLKVQWLEAPKV